MLNEKVLVFADESFHAKVEAKPFFDVPLHAHPFYEIILIKSGEGTCYTEGESLPFGAGDIFFWGKGIMHTLKCPEIYYSPDVIICLYRFNLVKCVFPF